MPNARLLAPAVSILVLAHPRLAAAVCGDGIVDPGESCLQPPVFVDADFGAAAHALAGEFVGPDGNLDVLLVRERTGGNDYHGYVGVLPGLGAAGLGPLVKWEFTDFTYGGPRLPSVADFDRDGLDDVVFVERGAMDFVSSSYFVEVWRSNGDGTFARILSHPDFDHDGLLDYATTGFDGSLWLAPGLGTGAFTAPVMLHDLDQLGLLPSVSLGADIDGDGFADLLACFRDVGPTLDVFLSWPDP